MLDKWLFADAEWWQFWLPRSGVFGGIIMGGLIFVIMITLTQLWG